MAKQKEIAISVKDLHKSFKLPHEQHSGLKQAILSVFKRNRKKGYEVQQVLKGLDFEIEKGDFFGIVGRNGSGKSTLLKTLAGIYTPDKGAVQVNGTLVPFIELGVGFNPELTGRENVFLNGALLGFSRDEMQAMYDEIVEFAELERFMDQKLKNYSSGMQVRLAFSIAIRADADILLLDEILAVGDEAFQRKCFAYFEELKKNNKTVILVTHDMGSVKKYCNKALMIRNGHVVAYGSPEDVANEYNVDNLGVNITKKDNKQTKNSIVKDLNVKVCGSKKKTQEDDIEIQVSYTVTQDLNSNILVSLMDVDKNIPLAGGRTSTELRKKNQKVVHTGRFDLSALNDTTVKVLCEVWDKDGNILQFLPDEQAPKFLIRRTDYGNLGAKWSVLFKRGTWSE